MNKKTLFVGASVFTFFAFQCAFTQDSTAAKGNASAEIKTSTEEQISYLKEKIEGLNESYAETKTNVDKLSKIKISGYTQFQYKLATNHKDAMDTANTGKINKKSNDFNHTYNYSVGNYAGGAFGSGITSMFQLRRARLKVAYESKLTTAVIQLDCLPFTLSNAATGTNTLDSVFVPDSNYNTTKKGKMVTYVKSTATSPFLTGGGVTIKDAYFRFTESWLSTFALKAGVFDRPFGFEIGYSSGNRETPERSRTEQTLFPGERDLGLSLEINPADNLPELVQLFNFKGGVFTGNGINIEIDNDRDYIGRFGLSTVLKEIGLGIDGGVSGYFGKVTDNNDAAYDFNESSKSFTKSTGKLYKTFDRKYYGGDLQLYYSLPVIGGFSLRGELYTGKQPGYSGTTSSQSNNIINSNAIYNRKFLGYYAWYVQNIDPIKSQFVLKFDSYDPNIKIKGNDIDSSFIAKSGGNAVTAADLMFNTIGIGWIYHWDENIKLMLYYDLVQNERVKDNTLYSNSSFWTYTKKADMKANVLTVRVQYKF